MAILDGSFLLNRCSNFIVVLETLSQAMSNDYSILHNKSKLDIVPSVSFSAV